MRKFSVLLIAMLLIGSVFFTSCDLFTKSPEESETESVSYQDTESENDDAESESTNETEGDTNKNDESDTIEFIDLSKDAYADDIYTHVEPEEIG